MNRKKMTKESEKGSDVVFGLAPVLEALKSDPSRIERVLVSANRPDKRALQVAEEARRAGVKIQKVPNQVISGHLHSSANHQGVLAFVSSIPYADESQVMADLAARKESICLVLNGIVDPHNLGAIIRTAECAGVDTVFVPERRSAGLTETVAKTSAGAVNYVRVVRVVNINRLIDELKEVGFWVAGADGSASVSYNEQDWTGKWAIVLGNEGAGMQRLTREKCDVLVKIPMYGKIDSLNVSVAAGVLLFEMVRGRKPNRQEQV